MISLSYKCSKDAKTGLLVELDAIQVGSEHSCTVFIYLFIYVYNVLHVVQMIKFTPHYILLYTVHMCYIHVLYETVHMCYMTYIHTYIHVSYIHVHVHICYFTCAHVYCSTCMLLCIVKVQNNGATIHVCIYSWIERLRTFHCQELRTSNFDY